MVGPTAGLCTPRPLISLRFEETGPKRGAATKKRSLTHATTSSAHFSTKPTLVCQLLKLFWAQPRDEQWCHFSGIDKKILKTPRIYCTDRIRCKQKKNMIQVDVPTCTKIRAVCCTFKYIPIYLQNCIWGRRQAHIQGNDISCLGVRDPHVHVVPEVLFES